HPSTPRAAETRYRRTAPGPRPVGAEPGRQQAVGSKQRATRQPRTRSRRAAGRQREVSGRAVSRGEFSTGGQGVSMIVVVSSKIDWPSFLTCLPSGARKVPVTSPGGKRTGKAPTDHQ